MVMYGFKSGALQGSTLNQNNEILQVENYYCWWSFSFLIFIVWSPWKVDDCTWLWADSFAPFVRIHLALAPDVLYEFASTADDGDWNPLHGAHSQWHTQVVHCDWKARYQELVFCTSMSCTARSDWLNYLPSKRWRNVSSKVSLLSAVHSKMICRY